MKYKNPPIVEAISEFRFSKETPWDPTIPGSVYERIKEHFPVKENKIEQQLSLKADASGLSQNFSTTPRAVMLSKDKASLVQVGQRLISINHLKPYAGWENFRPKIELAYDTICEVTEIKGIDRLALVYVDRIEIPGDNIEMGEYYKFYPYLGSGLPQTHANFSVACAFPYHDERDFCKLQLTAAMPTKKDHLATLLTTEYFLMKKKSVSPDNAIEWMEQAHTKVRELFKGCITEKLENIFERID